MNLYIQWRPNQMRAHLLDADSRIVGVITDEVARYLITKGLAMALNEKKKNGMTFEKGAVDA